jgi:hypothetical protein
MQYLSLSISEKNNLLKEITEEILINIEKYNPTNASKVAYQSNISKKTGFREKKFTDELEQLKKLIQNKNRQQKLRIPSQTQRMIVYEEFRQFNIRHSFQILSGTLKNTCKEKANFI